MRATNGVGDRRSEGILFLVHLVKFESDIATSKNIAIINYYNLLVYNIIMVKYKLYIDLYENLDILIYKSK